MSRRVCVVTGSRAEYGLLYWLLKEIEAHPALTLQLVATGMHLSPEFGLTVRDIEKDGFRVDRKVENLLSSDSASGISKSIGLGVIGFADAFEQLRPEIVVLLGDRFEIFAAAQAALVANIPIAHLHGGETTEGAIDEAFRHAITKMAHLHFTAAEEYRQRVLQMGEAPERVFNFGAAAIDNLKRLQLLPRAELEQSIGRKLASKNLLVTFHPATMEPDAAQGQFEELLKALDRVPEVQLLFTMPNADAGGRALIALVNDYVSRNPDRAAAYTSLGQLRYLSLMRQVDGVVGNSSSGIIEAPFLRTGTVNIGDRQKGRVRAASVIDCDTQADAIAQAIETLLSPQFQSVIKAGASPYGDEPVAARIAQVLADTSLEGILKKSFHGFDPHAGGAHGH